MKQEWYEIIDLFGFTSSLREMIIEDFYSEEEKFKKNKFGGLFKEQKEQIEKRLSLQEAENIVSSFVKTKKDNLGNQFYTISKKSLAKALKDLNTRITSNILKDLVSKGVIDTAYDNEKNDFIFWIKDQDNLE
jgi:molecular chaperone DnaK (HSP70)